MKKPTYEEIQKAKAVLKAAGILEPMWSLADIESRLDEQNINYNVDDVTKIAAALERNHDATIGINWEVIDTNINLHFNH